MYATASMISVADLLSYILVGVDKLAAPTPLQLQAKLNSDRLVPQQLIGGTSKCIVVEDRLKVAKSAR